MARWHICYTQTSVQSDSLEYSRAFGPGSRVDLDEAVSPGVTLADLVAVRCFAPVEEEPAPAATRLRRPQINIVSPAAVPSVVQE